MRSELFGAFLLFLMVFLDFSLLYSTLFHMLPLTFHCVDHGISSNHSARSDPHIILFLYLFMWIRRTCSARKWRCGSNSERKLWTRFEFADFFLVRAASLFTLRTFSAQINWRVISRKALFDPQRFLSNKSPIQFAGESGKGNMFLNGKRHVQNENGHRLPRSQTYAQQL